MPGENNKCYKGGEATEVYWDAVPEANYPPGRMTENPIKNCGIRIKPVYSWSTDSSGAGIGSKGK